MNKTIFFLSFFLLIVWAKYAQAQDTLQVLTLEEYYEQIVNFHPIVKQANLYNDLANQEIRTARGGFDPKFKGDYKTKQFEKKDYYNLLDAELSAPFWLGDIKLGFQQNSGQFLNPENNVPDQGLVYAGVSIPVLRGLLIDERRATLREAQLYQEIAQAERRKKINKVMLTAAKDYWNWYFRYQQYLFLEEGYELALIRFEAVKRKVEVGDEAPIDSVEAKITLQTRDIQRKQAYIDLQNARLTASNHLWDEEENPLAIAENVAPEEFDAEEQSDDLPTVEELIQQAEINHPELIKLDFKQQQLVVQENLARNNFLPDITLSYNFLNQTITGNENKAGTGVGEDYQFGVKVAVPILFREKQGKLQKTIIKQEQTNLELIQKNREIQNEIFVNYNTLNNTIQLIDLQEDMVNNYQVLRNGEIQKFNNGESSLFLVNSRETKLIESQVKLEKLKSEYGKSLAQLKWAAGVLFEE